MAGGEDQKISVLLNGGIDDRGQSELRAPLLQQGQAPTLVQSSNTRLSRVRGTPVRAPGITSISGTGAASLECYGVAVCEAGEAAVEFFLPGAEGAGLGNRAIYVEGASTSVLRRALVPTELQGAYVPTVVEPVLSQAPSEGLGQHTAMAWDTTNGHLWVVCADSGDAYYVYVIDVSGRVIAPLQIAFTDAGALQVAITWHGANGMYLWYEDGTGLRKRNATLSGSLVTVGAETAVYSPAGADDAFAVCRIDDTLAAILGTSGSDANDAVLRRHNVTSGAETTVTLTGAAQGTTTYYAIACENIPSLSADRIAIAYSRATSPVTQVAVYQTDLTNVWGPSNAGATGGVYGQCSVRFQDNADGARVWIAVSPISGSFDAGTAAIRTELYTHTIAAGTVGVTATEYYLVQANRGAQLRIGTQLWPLFFLQRCYSGPTPPSVSSNDFVTDPGIDAYVGWSSATLARVSPIARFGVVRGVASPARCLPHLLPAGEGAVSRGSTVYCAWLTSDSGVESVYRTKITAVTITPRTLQSAHDKSGVAIIAAGLPVEWDGITVSECGGPLYRPHLRLVTSGGGGAAFPAGVYSFLAMYEWFDAAAQRHRSTISNIVTMTATGTEQPVMTVTASWAGSGNATNASLRESVRVRWFGTTVNGITYHEIAAAYAAASVGNVVFSSVPVPLLESPQVYSTGEAGQELMPQPPAPMSDVAIVGDRAFAIDAEIRSRVLYSKHRIAGVGYEWNPALEINFPAGGGNLQRTFELSGVPVFVAERATYYVTGEGPDNTGAGGFFSAPTKVSEHGCSNALALCVFPGGAVWQDSDRWVIMRGLQTAYDESVSADFDAVGTILLRRSSEAVFVNRNGGAKVYNYELNRWTTWDTSAVVATAITANAPYNDNIAYLYSPDNGALYKLTDGTYTAASTMALQTDVLLPSGDFQDHLVLQRVVFRAERTGQHALTMSLYTNESSSATTSRTWTSGEIDSYLDAAGCYVVTLEPVEQDTRGVRIRIADDTTGFGGAGMRPIALTLVWGVEDSMVYEEQFRVDTQRK